MASSKRASRRRRRAALGLDWKAVRVVRSRLYRARGLWHDPRAGWVGDYLPATGAVSGSGTVEECRQ